MNIGKLQNTEITTEVKKAYLDYAMSVIVSRALPDVRDGLKPVHRRILYSMSELGLSHSSKYSKKGKGITNKHSSCLSPCTLTGRLPGTSKAASAISNSCVNVA